MKAKSRNPLTWLSMQLGAKLGIGLITILPLAVTVFILYWIFVHVDDILQPVVTIIWGHPIPGVGFAATIVLILLVGIIASNVIGRRLIQYGERAIPWFPIVRQLYTGVKQIMDSFSAAGGTGRMIPVLVEFPRKGIKSLGFITSELQGDSGKKLLTVFVPHTPNPTSGFLLIVEEGEVVRTGVSLENALKTVLSVGRVVPEEVADSLFFHGKE